MSLVVNPYSYFTDTNGNALNGYLYVGEVGKNAENYPIAIFYDNLFTTPAPNPLTISAGYIYNSGTIAQIYASVDYSIVVKKTDGSLVYSSLNETGMTNGAIANVDEMKSFVAPYDNYALNVLGYSEAGDGGGGLFYYDASSTEDDNGGTIIEPTNGSGRWIRVYDFVKLEYFGVVSPDYVLDSNWTWDATIDKSTANLGTIIDPSVGLDEQGTGSGLGCMIRQYDGAVNVKWFGAKGDGVTDDTILIQNILNSFNTVFIPAGVYMIKAHSDTDYVYAGLVPLSNTVIYGEKGSILKAITNDKTTYSIFRIQNKENIEIRDLELLGDKDTHTGTTGEFGMGLWIVGSSQITLSNLLITKCWGDGIYIGQSSSIKYCENVIIDNVKCLYNRRQGMSIISAKEMIVENSEFSNTSGTAPALGIDIEPNNAEGYLDNLVFNNIICNDNDGGGFSVALLAVTERLDINITVNNLYINGGYTGISCNRNFIQNSGSIVFNDCVIKNTQYQGINIRQWRYDGVKAIFNNPTIINPNRAGVSFSDGAFITAYTLSSDTSFPTVSSGAYYIKNPIMYFEAGYSSPLVYFVSFRDTKTSSIQNIKLSDYDYNYTTTFDQSAIVEMNTSNCVVKTKNNYVLFGDTGTNGIFTVNTSKKITQSISSTTYGSICTITPQPSSNWRGVIIKVKAVSCGDTSGTPNSGSIGLCSYEYFVRSNTNNLPVLIGTNALGVAGNLSMAIAFPANNKIELTATTVFYSARTTWDVEVIGGVAPTSITISAKP